MVGQMSLKLLNFYNFISGKNHRDSNPISVSSVIRLNMQKTRYRVKLTALSYSKIFQVEFHSTHYKGTPKQPAAWDQKHIQQTTLLVGCVVTVTGSTCRTCPKMRDMPQMATFVQKRMRHQYTNINHVSSCTPCSKKILYMALIYPYFGAKTLAADQIFL